MLLRATILLSGVKWTVDALFTEEITRRVLLWSWTTFKVISQCNPFIHNECYEDQLDTVCLQSIWLTWEKNFLVWGPTSRKLSVLDFSVDRAIWPRDETIFHPARKGKHVHALAKQKSTHCEPKTTFRFLLGYTVISPSVRPICPFLCETSYYQDLPH